MFQNKKFFNALLLSCYVSLNLFDLSLISDYKLKIDQHLM